MWNSRDARGRHGWRCVTVSNGFSSSPFNVPFPAGSFASASRELLRDADSPLPPPDSELSSGDSQASTPQGRRRQDFSPRRSPGSVGVAAAVASRSPPHRPSSSGPHAGEPRRYLHASDSPHHRRPGPSSRISRLCGHLPRPVRAAPEAQGAGGLIRAAVSSGSAGLPPLPADSLSPESPAP